MCVCVCVHVLGVKICSSIPAWQHVCEFKRESRARNTNRSVRVGHGFHSRGNFLDLSGCGKTMQGILKDGGGDNYCMDSVTFSIKHLSSIWLMYVFVCVCAHGSTTQQFVDKFTNVFFSFGIIHKNYSLLVTYSLLFAPKEKPTIAPYLHSELCIFHSCTFRLCKNMEESTFHHEL